MASEVMQGYFSIKLSITELFFGTQHFIKNGNAIDYKDLLKLLLGKLNTKNNYLDIYGKLGKISSAYAMIHVLSIIAPNEVDENAEFLNFKTQLLLTDKAILNEIILMTKTFIQ